MINIIFIWFENKFIIKIVIIHKKVITKLISRSLKLLKIQNNNFKSECVCDNPFGRMFAMQT